MKIITAIRLAKKFRSWSAVTTAFVLFVAAPTLTVGKTDRNAPHPHQPVLRAYQPGPFKHLKLSRSDEDKLSNGQPVMKQNMPGKGETEAGGGAICVQDIAAPTDAVWNQILDLEAYKGKVPKVLTSKNYFVGKVKDGSRIKTKMVLGVLPGYSYESYYDHTFHNKQNSMTWKLDYDKTSDFGDVSGHWHVEEHPTKPDTTRVFYACDIKLNGSVPSPILNYISKAALKQATGWVKKESEKNPNGMIPAKYGGSENRSKAAAAAVAAGGASEPPAKKRRFGWGW